MASPSPESNQRQPPPPWVPLETKDCSQGFCSPYCPQWCYIVFPPPPPPPFSFDEDTTTDSSSGSPTFSPLVIAVIGILASAFLLIVYYSIISNFCGATFRRRHRGAPLVPDGSESDNNEDPGGQSRHRHEQEWHLPPTVGIDEALISKITVCRYKRGDGLVGCTDCSVCLGEFLEDESLRLLPKCGHAFHVQCIDAWLGSHSNCPLCRANIVVSANPAPPQLPAPPPDPVSGTGHGDGVRISDGTVVVVVVGEPASAERASLENGREEMHDAEGGQQTRRSFSMGSFRSVSVADDRNMAGVDDEIMVGGSSCRQSDEGEHSKQGSGASHCASPIPMKRSVSVSSTGRFCLTRQGRGRNSVLPI